MYNYITRFGWNSLFSGTRGDAPARDIEAIEVILKTELKLEKEQIDKERYRGLRR